MAVSMWMLGAILLVAVGMVALVIADRDNW